MYIYVYIYIFEMKCIIVLGCVFKFVGLHCVFEIALSTIVRDMFHGFLVCV
jgi:hypothetical protein